MSQSNIDRSPTYACQTCEKTQCGCKDVESPLPCHFYAEPVKQEPVAWGMVLDGEVNDCIGPTEHARCEGDYTIALYASPVRTKDLTDEEQLELARSSVGKSRHWLVAAVIAAHKEKNNANNNS